MAQYGKNYYGGSYYGVSGVFAGQFMTDQTNLITPLTNVPPSDGKLYIDIASSHPRITYTYPDDIFIRNGVWTSNYSLDGAFVFRASLVASDMVLNYVPRVADGATIDIEIKTYIGGGLVNTITDTINTATGDGSYDISPSQFGEQVITIIRNTGSAPTSVFEFGSLDAMTTDIKLEFRSKDANNTWTVWQLLTLEPLVGWAQNSTEGTFNNVYKYEVSSDVITAHKGYQIKLFMATSDGTNSPELMSMGIHTVSTSDYSLEGLWKTTIDLGADFGTVDSITFDSAVSAGTSLEICSRTSNVDGNWSSWSVPYSAATGRVILDYKVTPATMAGYIMTPLVTPADLTTWNSVVLDSFLNNKEPFSGASIPGANIIVEIVNANYNSKLTTVSNQRSILPPNVLAAFFHPDPGAISDMLSTLKVPVRVKINFVRNANVSSPAVDAINIKADALYNETRIFGDAEGQLKGYGCAVYSHNTGIDTVYTDGLTRANKALVSSFGYTIPSGAENPEYYIEINDSFARQYGPDEVDIYWNSNSSKMVRLENGLVDDYIICRVKETTPAKTVRKCYKYGSGIVLSLDPNTLNISVNGVFTPHLTSGKKYAYLIQNGFTPDIPNDHVDIRWQTEKLVDAAERRNIVYDYNSPINISIIQSSLKGLVEWVSEQKKFQGVVNNNDVLRNYSATIVNLPKIIPSVIVNPDPSVIPYDIEIIEGSVTSHGKRKPEGRLVGTIRYLYAADGTPSLEETIEEKVAVVRGVGNKDYLPKAMVKSINAVYNAAAQFAPYYVDGTDFDYINPTGYCNEIDWAKGIVGSNGAKAPDEGDIYYVTYTYDKVVSLRVEFTCDYSEFESSPQIYRSSTVHNYNGQCSLMLDYVSNPLSFESFTIDPNVDTTTLRFIIYDNNPRVRTYLDKYNRVVGTLDKRDPRQSWNAAIYGGYYYIDKDRYFMFMNPKKCILGSNTIPIADNVAYVNGHNGRGVLVEEATTNLLSNTTFDIIDTAVEDSFFDGFERV